MRTEWRLNGRFSQRRAESLMAEVFAPCHKSRWISRIVTAMRNYRLAIALGAIVIWIVLTLWGVWEPHDPVPLTQGVAGGIAWSIIGAGLFLAVVVLLMRWTDLGFNAPQPWSSLRVLIFPAFYLLIFAAGALFVGLPAPAIIGILAINTLAVGFSEELMFRGVLFRALHEKLATWPAIWVTSLLFGSVHVLNGLTTGDFAGSTIQATTAFMSGVFFLAVVLRTGSIIPAMLFHAAWDFLLLTTAAGAPSPSIASPTAPSMMDMLVPILVVAPNFLYALFLLRGIGKRTGPLSSGSGIKAL